jgi:hypothetical protein
VDSSEDADTARNVPPVLEDGFTTAATAAPKPVTDVGVGVGLVVGVDGRPACATNHTTAPITRVVAAAPAAMSTFRRRRPPVGSIATPSCRGAMGQLDGACDWGDDPLGEACSWRTGASACGPPPGAAHAGGVPLRNCGVCMLPASSAAGASAPPPACCCGPLAG